MKEIIYIFLIIHFSLNSCIGQKRTNIDYRNDYDREYNTSFDFIDKWGKLTEVIKDSLKYEMYKKAYSTRYSDHQIGMVVILAHNLLTGITKEIAVSVLSLSTAIHYEKNILYSAMDNRYIDSLIVFNKNRLFEFSNPNAIYEINFDLYTPYDLLKFSHSVNIDSIKSYINSNPLLNRKLRSTNKNWMFNYTNESSLSTINERELTLLAHILFNEGILTYNGNGILYYFDF